MYRVKIYGAGSVGNHLANAARQLGWDVVVCDVSSAALERMKNEIYPARYGMWDSSIQLYKYDSVPVGSFDLIYIGTPPQYHIQLALEALKEKPKAILIEKPACLPSLEMAQELYQLYDASATKIFVGYNHVVGKALQKVEEHIKSGIIGEVQTIDVEFREHWGGIFKAHPWLKGPGDSYLGFSYLGGGASGEHSHAVNLWQHLSHVVSAGRVVEVDAMLTYVTQGQAKFDSLCLLNMRTESGLVGRVVQDVVTLPPSKRAMIQGNLGMVEWVCGYNSEGDTVLVRRFGVPEEVYSMPKTRADDFIEELKHIVVQIEGSAKPSSICLERGLDSMLVVAGAHNSETERCRVQIDYSKGYKLGALYPCHI